MVWSATGPPIWSSGLNIEGKKEALSLVIGTGDESAKFWLKVLNDLRNRGLRQVCVVCCDGLTALPEAVEARLRRRVGPVLCRAPDPQLAQARQLQGPQGRSSKISGRSTRPPPKTPPPTRSWRSTSEWAARYPMIGEMWRAHWERFIPFFAFPEAIRRIIYTTNSIEAVNRQLRKIIKTRGHFPTEDAALKLLWLALMRRREEMDLPDQRLVTRAAPVRDLLPRPCPSRVDPTRQSKSTIRKRLLHRAPDTPCWSAKRSARSIRIRTTGQLRHLVITAPDNLRVQLAGLTTKALVSRARCTSTSGGQRPGPSCRLDRDRHACIATCEPHQRRDRCSRSSTEWLVRTTAPQLLELYGVGVDTAAILLVAAGDNAARIRSEAAWAHLCGVAPIPAFRQDEPRPPQPGGNRHANHALWRIVFTRLGPNHAPSPT